MEIITPQFLQHILEYARIHLTPYRYIAGDILVDHQDDPYLYIFESGSYSIKTHLLDGDNYEIGNITAPDIMGEGVLFGHTEKAVKVVALEDGVAYKLTKEEIESINKTNPEFQSGLTTASLLSSNNRIMEANIERMLLYTMSNYLENHTRNIVPLLTSMKQLFSMHTVSWIERHEVLEDIYILRYNSDTTDLINTKIDMWLYDHTSWVCNHDFVGIPGCTFLFPIVKGEKEVYGYIALSHPDRDTIAGYIGRVFRHMNPLFVEVIEEEWKKRRVA